MKKLENIPKTNIFKVPDGYFEKLPLEIQDRVEKNNPVRASRPYFRYALQYAIPVFLIAIVSFFIFRPSATPTVESMLSSVSTDELVAYLAESNLTTDELLENFEFDAISIEAIEQEVYIDFELDSNDLDLLNSELDFDLDNL